MSRIQGALNIHLRQIIGWVYVPWGILLASFLVNYTISLALTSKTDFYTGGISSIVVYMFVAGIIAVTQTFPFALNLSIRRKDYFLGTILMISMTSFFTSIVWMLLSGVEVWTNSWGTQLHFFNLPYLNEGSLFQQMILYFLVLINLGILGFGIGSIYQRFGGKGTLLFFAVLFVLSSFLVFIISRQELWVSLFRWFVSHSAFEIALSTIPLTLVYAAITYLLLRRSGVR
ncbi:hypothetical protein [Paenibacillus lutrae]|uniref:Uncharacterized protein n=1 Tax=Paenibacillus lutrae TaxID=2078573 RepID=A0A7X3JXL7_9BACL|nr:hypothetical protein [Paenibacillus lutrae]MVO98132.1 hypothetical protein [Paenibacillus lutrae]